MTTVENQLNQRIFDDSIQLKDNAMLKVRPELFYEWDFEKNDELGLDVYKVTFGVGIEAWWNCGKCGSSYMRSIVKTVRADSCRFCAGLDVNETNSLASLRPDIASEWHPTKNGDLTPHNMVCKSTIKVWWLCSQCDSDYSKSTGDISKVSKGKSCPYCNGSAVNQTNSLASLYPKLLLEWHPELNVKMNPDDIHYGGSQKVWWKCLDCESDYDAKVADRTSGTGCSYCTGKKINHTNSLATLRPDLASEWHPTKNGGLSPHEVTTGNSSTRVWWLGECGHTWDTLIVNRAKENGSGCPYCSPYNAKILIGFNDMWTTNPAQAKLLANPEDGHRYMQMSNKKVDWKCLSCAEIIKQKAINNINTYGLPCPRCSDGISYGEKIIYNLLKENSIEFDFDTSFKWSKRRRYDFYLPDYNWIIEVHGLQHYEGFGFGGISEIARSLAEENKNDKLKENLALSNGISKYIVLDARYSTIEHIKRSVMISELSGILTNIDFVKIGQLSEHSLVKDACDLWNTGNYSTKEIVAETKLSTGTIAKYLKRGAEIGWCDYVATDRGIPVVQISLDQKTAKQWNSVAEASSALGVEYSGIYQCVIKDAYTAYGYFWIYKEEYDELKSKIHSNELILDRATFRKIVQLDMNSKYIKTWASVSEASQTLDIANSGISNVCRGVSRTAGRFKWMYKEDYDACSPEERLKITRLIDKRIKEVVQLSLEGDYIRTWDGGSEAARSLNLHASHISAVLKGKLKTAGGFKWMYKEDYDKMIS